MVTSVGERKKVPCCSFSIYKDYILKSFGFDFAETTSTSTDMAYQLLHSANIEKSQSKAGIRIAADSINTKQTQFQSFIILKIPRLYCSYYASI
jgi:hypothetical protein